MLLIDSGNSAIKCRLLQHGKVVDRTFSIHQDPGLVDLADYIRALDTPPVYLASVSGASISQKILGLLEHQAGLAVTRLTTQRNLGGLSNAYDNPLQLGVDRWLALLAAYQSLDNDVFVIDAGSAIKVDLLSRHGGHLGGAILPGIQTSLKRFQQLFPGLDFSHPDINKTDRPGRSTAGCIHLSEAVVSSDSINRLLLKWQNFLQQPVSVVATGQDAAVVCQQLQFETVIQPDLVFNGMLKQIQLLG